MLSKLMLKLLYSWLYALDSSAMVMKMQLQIQSNTFAYLYVHNALIYLYSLYGVCVLLLQSHTRMYIYEHCRCVVNVRLHDCMNS